MMWGAGLFQIRGMGMPDGNAGGLCGGVHSPSKKTYESAGETPGETPWDSRQEAGAPRRRYD